MSNHPAWHDQQPQYPPPPPPPQRTRHHSGMDAYQGPSPSASASAQQPPPYNSAPQHTASYPHAHLPPPAARHTPQQQQQQQHQQQQHPQQPQWASGTSQDFGGPSPASSAPRSNSGYTGFDPSSASNNSPMRQHGGSHSSAYTTHSPYAPPQSHAPDAAMHPQRPSMPSHYDYQNNYPHPHHPQNPQMPPQHHPHPHPHPHPSQQQQQQHQPAHWNTGPLPSVLQPQSAPLSSTPSSNRGPSAPPPPPHHAMDRAYPTIKHDDDMDDDDTGNYDDFDPKGKARAAADATQAANKGTSDFVKKLFSMLDDKAYDSVVAWSPSGESFIVKDMNDFTKHVLPRNFRHSNFASFVRQLNKYDFHKVKNPEDGAASVGEHVWEFQHPDFVRGRDDLLENVKRKIPAKKKPAKPGLVDADRDDSPAMPAPVHVDAPQRAESDAELRAQVAHLTAAQDQMQNHILALTKQYQGVIGEMLTFQRNMIQQDQLMQNLIQYLINLDQDRPLDGATAPPSANSFLAHMGANPGFLANPAAASAASHAVGASAPGGGADAGPSNHAGAAPPLSPKSVASPLDATGSTPEISAQLASLRESNPLAPMMLHPPHLDADPADSSLVNAAASAARNPSLSSFEKAGLRVFTVGTLQPRDSPGDPTPAPPQELAPAGLPNGSAGSSFDVHANGKGKEAADDKKRTPTPGEGQASKHLRVRRSTLVPGWAVPPRVLLVDDDEVCRRLSSKFLQVFGCSIDYAVDGMSAVNKMNLEKYDLVLMDIVMPNLDGMSATSLIRQFDPRTPIISMTSNSGPSELVNYMSSGMTDILPKPFTKEGLLNMLEKHLLHLKAARGTGQEGPKGVSPAPAATPSGTVQTGADDGTLNPLAGMGFTDEEYVAMLQNLIAAGTQDDEAFGMDLKDGKRMAEESGGENKRQRFVDS